MSSLFSSNFSSNFSEFPAENDNLIDLRFNRNFEELITERNEVEYSKVFNINFYDNIFDNIKDKLFSISHNLVVLTEEQESEYSIKYNTSLLIDCINSFKKNMCCIYDEKIRLEIEIQEKRKEYSDFCKIINDLLYKLVDSDQELNILLTNKLDSYFNNLGLEKLTNNYNKVLLEFNFLRKTLLEFSSIHTQSICSVCMDRQVEWFVDPCGHTICDKCKNKCKNINICHYCRTVKNEYKSMYFN